PPGVTSAFRCLIPGAFMFTIVWIISNILSFDVISISNALFNELFWIVDTLPVVTIAEFLEVVFWSIGLHGDSIVESITGPFMIIYDLKNVEAKVLGIPLPHVYGNTFHTCYAVPGGSGCTMGLALLYLRSKSKRLRKIGKLGLMSGIFNINEPITFGTPIVMNPLMIVPFVLVSTLNSFIAYYLISIGLIQRFYVIVPWTTPAPLGALLASGDINACILSFFCEFINPLIIYYPFFKKLEERELENEGKGM
ncbi:MAG: PTS sugar transporter subunit IIC, partial [Candidatus Odinarchaeota archaeon]|nr:PTS sugar transporter subunit IIC [Candidatus Odinarchaeota archaeon]